MLDNLKEMFYSSESWGRSYKEIIAYLDFMPCNFLSILIDWKFWVAV